MARQKKVRDTGAGPGFEEKLWQAADKLRGHMDAAEYEHVVLGPAFLKYILKYIHLGRLPGALRQAEGHAGG